jgi:uncharacterized protein
MRAVIDTNVYVSALVFGGVPRSVFEHAEKGTFALAVSAAIQEETARILREKFGWSTAKCTEALKPMWEIADVVIPQCNLSVLEDETDNRILECADEAGADFVVSGDNDLLSLTSFEGIAILTVRQFLDRLTGAKEE